MVEFRRTTPCCATADRRGWDSGARPRVVRRRTAEGGILAHIARFVRRRTADGGIPAHDPVLCDGGPPRVGFRRTTPCCATADRRGWNSGAHSPFCATADRRWWNSGARPRVVRRRTAEGGIPAHDPVLCDGGPPRVEFRRT